MKIEEFNPDGTPIAPTPENPARQNSAPGAATPPGK
jgi:hypothetical protein